jgi:antitoxin MazE
MDAKQNTVLDAPCGSVYTHCIITAWGAVESKIRKWGNSLGLRIPKAFAEEVGVEAGSAVDLSIEDGDLVVRVWRPPTQRLEQLLRGVTPENLHGEVGTGEAVGREVW